MAFARGPKIITDGLQIAVDPSSIKSYPGSGTSVLDLSGNSYSGTLNNGATVASGSATDSDKYIYFEQDDHMTFANVAALQYQPLQSFSLMAVFSLTSIAPYNEANQYDTNNTLFGKGSTSGAVGLGLRRQTNGNLSIYAGSRGNSQLTETYSISADTIYCTTLTYGPEFQHLYVNGAFISRTDTSGGAEGTFDNTGWRCFYPGAVPGGNSANAVGKLFLARLYSKKLSEAEVQQNFNSIKSRFNL